MLLTALSAVTLGSTSWPAAAKQSQPDARSARGSAVPHSQRRPCAPRPGERSSNETWCAEFGFLSTDDRYRVALPLDMAREPELASAVTLNGVPRSIVFARGVTPSEIGGPLSALDQLRHGVGLPDLDLRMPDEDESPSRLLFFAVADGYLWTHVEPREDGPWAVVTMLANLRVTESAAGDPHVSLGRLPGGNPSERLERDTVMFFTRNPRPDVAAVSSVYFQNAGRYARQAEREDNEPPREDDDGVSVTRATPMGVTVTCDGRADQLEHLRALTKRIASSLRPA